MNVPTCVPLSGRTQASSWPRSSVAVLGANSPRGAGKIFSKKKGQLTPSPEQVRLQATQKRVAARQPAMASNLAVPILSAFDIHRCRCCFPRSQCHPLCNCVSSRRPHYTTRSLVKSTQCKHRATRPAGPECVGAVVPSLVGQAGRDESPCPEKQRNDHHIERACVEMISKSCRPKIHEASHASATV